MHALVKRIRAIDAKTPIAVSLDMHANLYGDIVENATVVAGYRTYPHVDMYESGALAGSNPVAGNPGRGKSGYGPG
jgi:microcystin degradation protein MlrC